MCIPVTVHTCNKTCKKHVIVIVGCFVFKPLSTKTKNLVYPPKQNYGILYTVMKKKSFIQKVNMTCIITKKIEYRFSFTVCVTA